jgi:hypothetical protein
MVKYNKVQHLYYLKMREICAFFSFARSTHFSARRSMKHKAFAVVVGVAAHEVELAEF